MRRFFLIFWKKKLNDPTLRKLLKGGGSTFGFKVISVVLSYLFALLVSRLLGAEAMGIFALTLVFLQVGSRIGRWGLDQALLRFISEKATNNDWTSLRATYLKGLLTALFTATLLTLLFYWITPILAKSVFQKPYLSSYFKVGVFGIIPMVVLFVNAEVLRGIEKINIYAVLKLCAIHFFGIIWLIILFHLFGSVDIPIWAYVLSIFVSSIFSIWFVHSHIQFKWKWWETGETIKRLLHVSTPMLVASSLTLLLGWVDIFILGIYETEQQVGIYRISFKIANVAKLPVIAVNAIAAPKFAASFGRKDFSALRKIVQLSTAIILWTSLPIIIVLLTFPKLLLSIFGSEFIPGYGVVIIITLGLLGNNICGLVGYILKMTGKQYLLQNIILITLGLAIVLNLILIPILGLEGAALASAFCMVFWNIIGLVFIKKHIGSSTFSFRRFLKLK